MQILDSDYPYRVISQWHISATTVLYRPCAGLYYKNDSNKSTGTGGELQNKSTAKSRAIKRSGQ